jgi:myo-inositol-1(or 4)-monophosphatase
MTTVIDIVDNEPTDNGLLCVGKDIAYYVAEEVKKRAREGTLGEFTGKTGVTGDKMKRGDDIADEVVKRVMPGYLRQGIGVVYVYSEEDGVYILGEGDKGIFIIIDPLDGSNNLRKGAPSPYVSVSVALGKISDLPGKDTFDAIRVGVVRDIFNNRTYHAVKGRGFADVYDILDKHTTELRTYDNDSSQIRVQTEKVLKKAIVGIDLDKGKDEDPEEMKARVEKLSGLLKEKYCQRRLGSTILDFCKVAAGEYDGFVSIGGRMKLHDVAAAKLIVEEAEGIFDVSGSYDGNLVGYMFGNLDRIDEVNQVLKKSKFKVVAAANPFIYEQIKDSVEF